MGPLAVRLLHVGTLCNRYAVGVPALAEIKTPQEIPMKAANIGLALILAPASAGLLTLSGCGSTPPTPAAKANLADDGQTTIRTLERDYPDLKMTIDNAYGYAIFPSVGKGGLVIDVASGRGVVYDHGNYIGTAHMTLVNVGATVIGEDYTELLIFKSKTALDNFKANQTKFDATAVAVALKAGASADAKFVNDVAIFTKAVSGFGVDASIGGQQFTFTADSGSNPTTAPAGSGM